LLIADFGLLIENGMILKEIVPFLLSPERETESLQAIPAIPFEREKPDFPIDGCRASCQFDQAASFVQIAN
jgi:hypothetical protein